MRQPTSPPRPTSRSPLAACVSLDVPLRVGSQKKKRQGTCGPCPSQSDGRTYGLASFLVVVSTAFCLSLVVGRAFGVPFEDFASATPCFSCDMVAALFVLALVVASTAFCLSALVGRSFGVPFAAFAAAMPAASCFCRSAVSVEPLVTDSTVACFDLSLGGSPGVLPWAPTVAANMPAMSAINSLFICGSSVVLDMRGLHCGDANRGRWLESR